MYQHSDTVKVYCFGFLWWKYEEKIHHWLLNNKPKELILKIIEINDEPHGTVNYN